MLKTDAVGDNVACNLVVGPENAMGEFPRDPVRSHLLAVDLQPASPALRVDCAEPQVVFTAAVDHGFEAL